MCDASDNSASRLPLCSPSLSDSSPLLANLAVFHQPLPSICPPSLSQSCKTFVRLFHVCISHRSFQQHFSGFFFAFLCLSLCLPDPIQTTIPTLHAVLAAFLSGTASICACSTTMAISDLCHYPSCDSAVCQSVCLIWDYSVPLVLSDVIRV